ncbi:hypothetical protein Q3G72_009495 [Acer saccharum]|nr:hypothetical protein Q3G72_009495 [Acer saccharum]
MVIGIASDHDIEENNILVSNFIEYMACNPRFPASSIGSHQSDSDGWVRVKLWVDDDLGMEFFQRFDIWEAVDYVVKERLDEGKAGLKAVSNNGEVACGFNTNGMFRGIASEDGFMEVAMPIWE